MTESRRRRAAGFTTVELLVVIGIIVLLASIVAATLGRARTSADRIRLGYQLQAITVGLDAYMTVFKSLPATSVANTQDINADGLRGARMLCKILMGACGAYNTTAASDTGPHQDGKAGLGFATVGRSGVLQRDPTTGEVTGATYGPYLSPDKFKLSRTNTDGSLNASTYSATEKYDDTTVILDANDKPILFYPVLNPQPAMLTLNSYVGPGPLTATPNVVLPMYRDSDNSSWLPVVILHKILGDVRDTTGSGTPDGAISPAVGTIPAETAAARGKYILYSAGPDGIFGPPVNADLTKAETYRTPVLDDVTNYQGD